MSSLLKPACARVETDSARGTAWLVTPQEAVTCAHVVQGVAPAGLVTLSFPSGIRQATVSRVDEAADCAVLALTSPLTGVTPLPLASDVSRGDPWESYGFPAVAGNVGLLLTGDVQDPGAVDPRGLASVALFSREIAAGRGAAPQGFSGSPVLVEGAVVGCLKGIVPDDSYAPRAEFGLLYACPLAPIRALLPGLRPPPPPPLQPPRSPYTPAWYVPRPREERQALNYLSTPGQPVLLWGAEQIGKTWALKHLLREGPDATDRVVQVSLDLFDPDAWRSLDSLLKELGLQILDALGLDFTLLETAWKRPGGPKSRLTWLMERQVLPACPGRLFLAIDQADSIIRHCRFDQGPDDFFTLLRGWASQADRAPWQALRLLLAVSIDPNKLTTGTHYSPFQNLSLPITLGLFGPEQVRDLIGRHGLDDQSLVALMAELGGHPWLTRLVLYHAALNGQSVQEVLKPESGLFDEFLSSLRLRLPERAQEVLLRLQRGESATDRETLSYLQRSGLVNAQGRLLCALFRRI